MSEQPETAVDLAYPLAAESYERLFKQIDAMDARIQTMVALATTLSLAFVAAVTGRGLVLMSWPLYFAAVMYAAGATLAVIAQYRGKVEQMSPKLLHAEWLEKPPADFKKDYVYWAGQHYDRNRRLVLVKWWLAQSAALAFLVELVLLAAWAVRRG